MVRKAHSAKRLVFFLLLLLFAGSTIPLAQTSGNFPDQRPATRSQIPGFSASVCTWKDNLSGALSITFDDGQNSQVANASPIMSLLDIRGTFFITIDNVGIPYGASWAQWQTVSNNGHEIASHSKTHRDLRTLTPEELRTEVVLTKSMIEGNLTGVSCQTFSYPMGLYNETVMDLVRETYISARQDRHNITAPPGPVPSSPHDMYSIVPVRFGTGNTASQLNAFVDQTLSEGGWLVEMVHAVGEGGYDPVDIGQFTSHMQYAAGSMDRLWIAPFGNVSKYIRLRDSAFLNMTHPEDHLLDIVLETPLNERVFDIPATLNISVPSDWIDIEIYRWGGRVEVVHTIDALDHRYFVTELGANERVRIVQANLNPHIELYEPEPGSGDPFTPSNGTSSDEYEFYLVYSSEMNRAPREPPMVWFDLNGNKVLGDVVGGVVETRVNMSKLDRYDDDYTDGCIYHLRQTFPPGTDMWIRFSALDELGLEAVSSTGMGSWLKGPVLDDPPTPPSNIRLADNHSTTPTFLWDPGVDPDGGDVGYSFRIIDNNTGETLLWYSVVGNNHTVRSDLFFDKIYYLSMRTYDEGGLYSEWVSFRFTLVNHPPPPIEDIRIEFTSRLNATFTVEAPPDPDGDRTTYVVTLKEMAEEGEITVFTRVLSNVSSSTYQVLKDHTNYTLYASHGDIWTSSGPFEKKFYVNFPPLSTELLEVKDANGEEDSLLITWRPIMEDDLDHYILLRYIAPPTPSYFDAWDERYEVRNRTFFFDTNVTDGRTYWYSVIGVDSEGEFDKGSVNYSVRGTPIDDVAPAPLDWIKVTFQDEDENNSARMLIEWNESRDRRFFGYRIYRAIEPPDDISGLTPLFYHNGTANLSSRWDFDIKVNDTFHYTVTAVDKAGNEMTTGLTWVSATYPYTPPPAPPETPDEKGDEGRNYLVTGIIIGAILLLIGGISYLAMVLLQKKNYYDYYDEE
ncbi:MAG: polysaccharide deacetylase family protein [Thermoplasmatota archaeon]